MTDQIDFSLPDEMSRPKESRKGRGPSNALLLLVLMAVIGMGVLVFLRGNAPTPRQEGLDADNERVLAAKLQDRGLNLSSAEAWLRYLEVAKLDPKEKATRYYDVGKLYQEEGDFEKALVNYYRSEAVAEVADLRVELARRKRECFRRLGNIAGLNRELEAMTSLAPEGQRKESEGEVVAEIGSEKITLADLDRRVNQAVELQVRQLARFMSGEQLDEQKEKLFDQFQSKQAKFEFLQDLIAKEVLLREAMKQGLDKQPDSEEVIEELRRNFLANEVLDAEIERKVNVTESDLRDYYAAHKEDFKEKPKVSISQIVTESEEDAQKALQALQDGRSFEVCAKEFSIDEETKEKGGEVELGIEKGGFIPGIENTVDVHAHLFAMKENEVSEKPVEVNGKFYIFRVRKVIPERIQPFEDVKYDVQRRKTREKVQEVQEALIERLQNEHNVIIHRSKFLPEKPEEETSPEAEKKKVQAPPLPGTI